MGFKSLKSLHHMGTDELLIVQVIDDLGSPSSATALL